MTERLRPPSIDAVRPDVAELMSLAVDPDGKPLGTIAVLAHTPDLVAPFLSWSAALALNGTMPKRDHELVALRVAHRCRSEFEFVEHRGYALDAGITTDEIARIRSDSLDAWAAHEGMLLSAVDQLVADFEVDDETWVALAEHYSAAQLVELTYVAGQYTMLSMVANALGVPARSEG